MTQRVAIVLLGSLERGEAANVAALLCGQVARRDDRFFGEDTVTSKEGLSHTAPKYSVVILKSKNASQLASLASQNPDAICFSRLGQSLNNAIDEYQAALAEVSNEDAGLIGVVVYGEDADVRLKTKKFSLMT